MARDLLAYYRVRIKKILSVLFFALIVIGGASYYHSHREEFHLITSISAASVLTISFLIVLQRINFGLQLKILTDHYRLHLTIPQCLGLSWITTFINLWAPLGAGASFKAVYLKKIHALNYSAYIASMGIANVLHVLVNSLAAIALLIYAGQRMAVPLFPIAAACVVASSSFLLFGHKMGGCAVRVTRYFRAIFEEWEEMRRDREAVVRIVILSCFMLLLMTFTTYFLFRAFSAEISVPASATIAVFSRIAGVMNLVPGNLGITEGVIIAISHSYGIGVNESVHAALTGRVLATAWTFILAAFFTDGFSKKTKE
jgi:uncharacterized membrane protein YbhN (UPF0104 family)